MPRNKDGKKIYILLAIIAVAGIGGYVFYKFKKDAFLDHQLQDMVQNKTNQLYKISYDSIHVDEVGGDVNIKNLYIKGDTSRQLQMLNRGDTNAAGILIDAYIPVLKVVDFKTAKALLSQQLICSQVIISDPKITLYLYPGQAKQKSGKKQQEEFYKQILGNLKLIKADSISVINSEVVATDFYTKETKFHTFNTSAGLSGVAIDSTYNRDTTRTFFCKEIKVTSDKVMLGDKNNTAEITYLSFDTRTEIVAFATFEYNAFKNKGFFKSKLEGVSLKGMNWTGPLENTNLSIDEADFASGVIETLAVPGNIQTTKSNPKPILTGWIKSFSLNKLHLKSFLYISTPLNAKVKILEVKNNLLYLKNFKIDRTAILDASLISKAEELEFSNDEISLTSEDKLYEYRFTGLNVNTKAKKISAKSIRIIPKLNEADFARKVKVQLDRYDINFKNVICSGVDIEGLVKGEIRIANIATSGNSIFVYHDRSYPIDSASKEGRQDRYPHQMLHKVNFPLQINKFTGNKTTIEYKEKNPKSENSGKVRFTNSTITIDNISNLPPKNGEKINLRFSGSFLEKIPVTAGITFYADQWKKGRFGVEAMIHKSFDATILNQLVQPLSLARIDKGTVHSLKFNITADTGISRGSLVLSYENFKISLLKKKGNEYNKKGVFSFLANILVKNSNKEGPDMRTGNIEVRPDKYKSFFNFIWMSIFNGAKQVLMFKI